MAAPYYQPTGSLYTTVSGTYNNPAPPPNTVITYYKSVPRFMSLTKGDWHIQLAINGQRATDLYFSVGLGASFLDHAIVIGQDFLNAQTKFDVGVNLIGSTAWLSNISAGCWVRLRYQRPDGTIAADNTWDPQFANSFSGFIGVRWFVNLDQTGTWHLIFDLNGQTLTTSDFQVVPVTSVLLIHGIWSSADTWSGTGGMFETLQKKGYVVEAVDFPTEKETQSNETFIALQAQAIARRIQELQGRSGKKLTNLICHSMGGLAARYYLEHPKMWKLQDTNGVAYSGVAKLIMLGTPNWGTDGAILDPVGSVAAGRFGSQPHYGRDHYENWSSAIKDIFAEWQAAPSKSGNDYVYPAGYKLGKWQTINHVFQSPIQTISYTLDEAAYSWFAGRAFLNDSNAGDAAAATWDVERAFPVNPRSRLKTHANYYFQTAQQLGIPYPAISGGIDGVDKHLISPFLYDLNTTPDTSQAKVYMVGGTLPVLNWSLIVFLAVGKTVYGPFNSDLIGGGISNDGVVPTDSALGRDPITGVYLYPQATRAIFGTYHTDMTNNADIINQVANWLSE